MTDLEAITRRNQQHNQLVEETIPLDLDLRVLKTLNGNQLDRLAAVFEDLAILTRTVKEAAELDQAAERGEAVQTYEHAAADRAFYRVVARLPAWVKL